MVSARAAPRRLISRAESREEEVRAPPASLSEIEAARQFRVPARVMGAQAESPCEGQ